MVKLSTTEESIRSRGILYRITNVLSGPRAESSAATSFFLPVLIVRLYTCKYNFNYAIYVIMP